MFKVIKKIKKQRETEKELYFLARKYRTELYELSIKDHSWNLKYVPMELRTPELCELAVKKNGWALEFVPERLKIDKLCESAVKSVGFSLKFVPEELRTKELCEIALAQGYLADELLEAFVPEEFKEELAEKYDLYLEPKAKGR